MLKETYMKEKARIPLLVSHIIGIILLLILMGIIFIAFVVGGIFAGAIAGIGEASQGEETLGKIILVGYIIDLFLALVVVLDVINLIVGFRKNSTGKIPSIFMIINMCLTSLLCIGVASIFARSAIIDIASSNSNVSSSILTLVIVLIILLFYLSIYILTIVLIYIPRIKNSKKELS